MVSTYSIMTGYLALLVTALVFLRVEVTPTATYRLPKSLIPVLYTLKIITDLGENSTFSFEGRVWIQMHCLESTQSITLHAKDIIISGQEVQLYDSDNNSVNISEQMYLPKHDFYIANTAPLIQGQNYTLYIPFSGKLSESLTGYYVSSYKSLINGKTRWLSVTQFEATDARKAFPCFDEPEMKAKFKISLGRSNVFNSNSNMPLQHTEPMEGKEGWYWDHYKTSLPMSSYLVAFIVSEFKHVDSRTRSQDEVMFRIWCREDAIIQTLFALETGPRVLEHYEKYFKVNYPLPKQDMEAIPDFNSGAMENWGLITYRETSLLYHPNVSSLTSKISVASVISHELAHQWFGNFVTMKWWTDLWLNEGFATYMAMLTIESVYPEWENFNVEVVESHLTVYTFDALNSSHPVSIVIGSPNEISEIFDTISYKKGGLILRMMNMFLGEEVFRSGITNYLNTHAYGNAEQNDLWHSLNDEAHEAGTLANDVSLKSIMDSWTLQTGYPLVTVTRDYERGIVTITQRRYYSYIPNLESAKPQCWSVPLSYTTQMEKNFENTIPKKWLTCNDSAIEIDISSSKDEWVIFNIGMAGLYKVQYDIENWQLLLNTMHSPNYKDIGLMNRVALMNDAMDLCAIGELSYETGFRLLQYLPHESEFLPWRAALAKFNTLYRLLLRTPAMPDFKRFAASIIQPVYETLRSTIGFNPTESEVSLQKVKFHKYIMSWACRLRLGDCAQEVRVAFHDWMITPDPDNSNPIHKDMRSLVYCYAIKYGTIIEWEFAFERYRRCNVGTEQVALLSALGCSRDMWVLNRFLEWSMVRHQNSGIRRQDSPTVFKSVARNDVGFYIAKDFFMKKIREMNDYYGSKAGIKISLFMTVLSEQIYFEDDVKQFKEFLAANENYMGHSSMGLKQATEAINVNHLWHQRNYEKISNLLNTFDNE